MNVHDSEKVIGTLVHEGYQQVETVEQGDLILYNTCSIRTRRSRKSFTGRPTTKNCCPRARSLACWLRSPAGRGKDFRARPACIFSLRISQLSQSPANAGAIGGRATRSREPGSSGNLSKPEARSPKPAPHHRTRRSRNRRMLRDRSPPGRIPIADTSPSSKAATSSARTAWCRSRAAKSAAALRSQCRPKPARWPIWATPKSSC